MVDIKRSEELYEKIKSKLRGKEGKIVALDPESGEFFVGDSVIQACDLGRKKHPKKQFYVKRVGAKHTFVVGAL